MKKNLYPRIRIQGEHPNSRKASTTRPCGTKGTTPRARRWHKVPTHTLDLSWHLTTKEILHSMHKKITSTRQQQIETPRGINNKARYTNHQQRSHVRKECHHMPSININTGPRPDEHVEPSQPMRVQGRLTYHRNGLLMLILKHPP